MKNVLLVAPTSNITGITTWTNRFLQNFKSDSFKLISIDSAPNRTNAYSESVVRRMIDGLLCTFSVVREVKKTSRATKIDILHLTTTGSLGTFRDFLLARICKNRGIKTIMICHYGNIPNVLKNKKILSFFLLKTMKLFDHIWVGDKKTFDALNSTQMLENKVFVVPNGMVVEPLENIHAKNYTNVAFIGNLIESKGIFELIKAINQISYNIHLQIVGGGNEKIIKQIKLLAGENLDKKIFFHGKKNNAEAVEFMKNIDILALPTYFPNEAFPLSILEAMSLGKLVISTRRAAIEDMLTAEDGSQCGIFVDEKSVEQLKNAIVFAYKNSKKADELCKKAYKKVYECYRTEVVYDLYAELYKKMF
ncbi:MAG: glycosyltransferase family 4 protein [Prevotellaceae bacterium]|jgi:glycosyltransferase involved in cell wall biosynthesis|nr:glycosyltransferase family 4 protein [Prevotellaceae bacterium]